MQKHTDVEQSPAKKPPMNPAERAAAQPTSLRAAINAKCWDCQGRDQDPGGIRRVRECTVKKCPLWPVRGWQTGSSDGGEES